MEHRPFFLGFWCHDDSSHRRRFGSQKKTPCDVKPPSPFAFDLSQPFENKCYHHIDRPKLSLRKWSTQLMCHWGGGAWAHAPPVMVFLQILLRGCIDQHAKARLEEEEGPTKPLLVARTSHAPPFLRWLWWGRLDLRLFYPFSLPSFFFLARLRFPWKPLRFPRLGFRKRGIRVRVLSLSD